MESELAESQNRGLTPPDLTSGPPLRPLLAHADLISGRLAIERARAITEALAVMKLPAAVLSPGHWIVAANESMIELIPGQLRVRSHRVALTDRRADTLLEKALLHVSGQSSSRYVCSIPIAGTPDNPPSITHVVPLRGAAYDVFSGPGCIRGDRGRRPKLEFQFRSRRPCNGVEAQPKALRTGQTASEQEVQFCTS